MPGGACEATAFASFGYSSTCLCLPLGNYHNMERIDEVVAGERPARVGREFIGLDDYHGLIEMLELIASGLDSRDEGGDLRIRLEKLRKKHAFVLER